MSTTHAHFIVPTYTFEANAPLAGDQSLRLAFAGHSFEFVGLTAAQAAHVTARFGPLLVTDTTPTHRVTVRTAPASAFAELNTVGWEYELATSHFPNHILVSGMRFTARIDRAIPMKVSLWTDLSDSPDFLDPFENVFRVLACYEIARAGGLVLHSAGFAHGDRGFVCFGHSGAGKTTLTGIADSLGLEILSDELNAIVVDGDSVTLVPMPFAGDFGRAKLTQQTMPLRALYRIMQSSDPSIEPVATASAVALLTGSSPFVNGDPHVGDLVLSNAVRLAKKIPVKILKFAKDERFWQTIQNDVDHA